MDEDGVVSKEEITMLALMPSDKKARPAAIARLGLCKLRGNHESNGSAQPIRAIGTRGIQNSVPLRLVNLTALNTIG